MTRKSTCSSLSEDLLRERENMLGRVRLSSSNSLEDLEMERLPSKLIKHDSLSIYERTLMKLKQGSQNALALPVEEAMTKSYASSSFLLNDEAITEEADCSSPSTTSTSLNSNDCQPIDTSNEHRKRNLSVLDMFSRYRNSQHVQISPDEGSMLIDNAHSRFDGASPCSVMSSTR